MPEEKTANYIHLKFKFTAEPWEYNGKGSWTFISLPVKMSKEIRSRFKSAEEGWGRLKVSARVGNSEWKTAIWYDTGRVTYILPLKAEIREKEKILTGKKIEALVFI